jgi:hypothetical protein
MIHLIKRKLSLYRKERFTRDFIKHNLRCFSSISKKKDLNGPEVLFELNRMHSAHIAYSYLANDLASKFDARIIAYSITGTGTGIRSIWRKLKWMLAKAFSIDVFAIYRSFGTSSFLLPQLNLSQERRANQLTEQVLKDLKNKSDIELIKVNGTWLGDLIYDSYLMTLKKPTIEISDKSFKLFLLNSLKLYVFWDDYFQNHDVRAVNVSHCVYVNAIPMRIAASKGIPVFQINATHVYRLSDKNYFAYNDFFDFSKLFRCLSIEVQTRGLEQAKQRIELRFSGKVGVDMTYSTKSAYGEHKIERLIKESPRTKILIATHCFFDSPHSYGNNLFPDFYEWLDFIGKVTLETDYDWYIKTHPDYLEGTMEVINAFIKKYPKINILPSDSSHHQIISEGINVALTTYGTIGFEYAALGIPVVNASLCNPHVAYNFNLHPKNIEEYHEVLTHLDHIDLNINKKEVYEYYFMQFIYNTNDWLFNDYKKMEEELGGYSEQFTPKVYEAWIREWTPSRHKNINAKLNSFVESGDFRLGAVHDVQNLVGNDIE